MPAREKPAPRAVAAAETRERDGRVDPSELRCGCGRLVARWVEGRVELRCHRCKSLVYLRLERDGTILVES